MSTVLKLLGKINIEASVLLDEPMARHTTFRIGGPADALVAPRDRASLLALVSAARAEGLPLLFLGGGANLLVGDRGVRGLVVDLRRLDAIALERLPDGRTRLSAGAGTSMARLCEAALGAGLAGLERFYGMPGSLGGSVYMNARCYEVELSERLERVEYLDSRGLIASLAPRPEDWSYKRSPFQNGGPASGALVLGASFVLEGGTVAGLRAVMLEKKADREAKGHYRLPSAGSVFKNDRSLGRPTGRILDELGLRGRRIGDALVSEWHANIFVNAGRARAADMQALIDLAREEAARRLGLALEPEVLFVGEN